MTIHREEIWRVRNIIRLSYARRRRVRRGGEEKSTSNCPIVNYIHVFYKKKKNRILYAT